MESCSARNSINKWKSALVRPSRFAFFPRLPHAELLHQIIHAGLMQGLVDLRMMQAGTHPLWSISNAEGKRGRLRHMLLQLRQIDLVESVGHGVIVDQVVRFLLVGYE